MPGHIDHVKAPRGRLPEIEGGSLALVGVPVDRDLPAHAEQSDVRTQVAHEDAITDAPIPAPPPPGVEGAPENEPAVTSAPTAAPADPEPAEAAVTTAEPKRRGRPRRDG